MGRQPCCDKVGLKRGPWTAEEDRKLVIFILTNGHCCWRAVPKLAGLLRCGKSCRLRWTNYLRPDLKRGLLSESEEQIVIDLHAKLGNRWSKIASHLPGRTDNEIKNHWNTHIKKKLKSMGIDPVTHKPITLEPPKEAPGTPVEDGMGAESGFCTDEVPMIQPEEILISPEDFPMSSSLSPSPNSSNTTTVDGGGDELTQLPNLDWLEELWDMDGEDDGTTISGLDLIGGDNNEDFLDRLMDADWSNFSDLLS